MTETDAHRGEVAMDRNIDGIDVLYVGAPTTAAALADEHEALSVETVETQSAVASHIRPTTDCIISEGALPDGTGREVGVSVREHHPGLPVILYTNDEGHARWAVSNEVAVVPSAGTAGVVALAERVLAAVGDRCTVGVPGPTDCTLAETTPDAVVTIDKHGVLRYANPAVEAVFGHEPSAVVGQKLSFLLNGRTAERYRAKLAQSPGRGDRTRNWGPAEVTGVRADGREIPLSITFDEFTHASERYVTGLIRDASDRRTIEETLQERDRQLATLFDNLPGIVYRARNEPDWSLSFVSKGCYDLTGYEPEELVDGSVSWIDDLVVAEDCERARETRRTAVENDEPFTVTYRVRTRSGELRWVREWGRGLTEDGEIVALEGFVTDVSERKRRERGLATLNDAGRDLLDAEDHDTIADAVISAIEDALYETTAAVALYDEQTGSLQIRSRTSSAVELDDEALLLSGDADLGWRAFIDGDTTESDELPETTPLSSGIALPLDRYGVLIVGTSNEEPVEPWEHDIVRLLAATTRVAFDRAERTRAVREHEQRLAVQNDRLERLARTNVVVRGIDRALVSATTRAEIEREVLERLVAADPYVVAWIEIRGSAGSLRPREWVGGDAALINTLAESSLTERAAETGSAETIEVFDTPPLSDWREEALEYGLRSGIAVPIVYGDSLYGVLSVYADRPDVFGGNEREVFAELGETIGHAMNAIERKRALISDEIVELEFRVGTARFVELSHDLDAEFEFLSAAHGEDDDLRAFFTVTGATSEEVLSFIEENTSVRRVSLVSEGDRWNMFEYVGAKDGLLNAIIERGGVPRVMRSTPDEARLIVELAASADVRGFVEQLYGRSEEIELVARRQINRPLKTSEGVYAELTDRLTDRQLEVLQTAYFGGFFESPRARTGSELGESLGITQPTFNQHLRAAQRTALGLIFGHHSRDLDN